MGRGAIFGFVFYQKSTLGGKLYWGGGQDTVSVLFKVCETFFFDFHLKLQIITSMKKIVYLSQAQVHK